MPFATKPEIEIEVETLVKCLAELPIDAVLSYEDIVQALGYDPRDERHYVLTRARQRAEKSGFRFETVHRIGIKKMSGEAIAGIGARARRKIGKVARRQSERLTNLSYNVTGEQRAKIDAERSVLGAISAVTSMPITKIEPVATTGPIVAHRIFDMLK